ncbi:MAG: HAF repeat/PEP-CTERM domain-containing protein [Nitrosospira sp.]
MKITRSSAIQSLVLAATLSSGLSFVSPVSAQQHSYIVDLTSKNVTDLGSLGTGDTNAQGINDAGQVVGSSYAPGSRDGENWAAFITGPNGVGMANLGLGSGDYNWSSSSGINAAGQVVANQEGYSFVYDGHPAYYTSAYISGPNGVGMTFLGTLGGQNSSAVGINDTGQVVGTSSITPPFGIQEPPWDIVSHTHAFITGPNGVGMTDLGTMGGYDSEANGINAAGQVVGWSDTFAGLQHAFITGPNGVGMTDLGTLGGSNSEANGINAAGQVVGWSDTAAGVQHAFITAPMAWA